MKTRNCSRILAILFLLISTLFITSAYASDAPASMSIPVYTTKAASFAWQPFLNATGTLVAQQGITIKADTSGRVTQVFFDSGQFVKQGAPLIQIFPDIIEAQLKENQAAFTLSQANYARFKELYGKSVVSKSDLDTALANRDKDEAAVAQSQAELSQTLIKAPFSGYLGIRKVNLGDYVNVGQIIANLQDTDPMYVDFSIPEVAIEKIKIGQQVTITSDAYNNQSFTGQISAIDSLVNPNTRTLDVRATVPNPNHILMPGVFVEINLYVAKASKTIVIPQVAVVYSAEGDYVYRVINNKAVKTNIVLGNRNADNIFITHGLNAGDIVITAGQMKLHDGAAVMMLSADPNSRAKP